MTDKPSLLGFTPLTRGNTYKILYQLLWPRVPTSSQPAAPEPEPLAQYIETFEPDLSLSFLTDDNATDKLEHSPPIRYIDLTKHRSLDIHRLNEIDKLIVRQEYVDFMDHANATTMQGRKRFILTGHHGIGKSIGAGYFLLHLLASGRSVFFIPNMDHVYCFSEAGVCVTDINSHHFDEVDVRNTLSRSWVIIDDLGVQECLPPLWAKLASCLVWTSPLKERRMRHFINQFQAAPWYMKPWSFEEIAAVTTLENRDPNEVRTRFTLCGPIARSLFCGDLMDTIFDIDPVINKALATNLFDFATLDMVDQAQVMFLVRPREVFDAAGKPSLRRTACSFDFVSKYIVSRTAELIEQHFEKVRRQLAHAFDSPATRSMASKLVESMLHRALIHRKIDLPAAFGGGPVKAEVELLGQAKDFFLKTHAKEQRYCRPLYLRPQSYDFAALSAILIMETVLCLIQTSLATLHSDVVKTLLQILTSLETNKIAVDSLRLVYCIVGTEEDRVRRLVYESSRNLIALQASQQAGGLRNTSPIAFARLKKLQVAGFTLDTQKGLMPLS